MRSISLSLGGSLSRSLADQVSTTVSSPDGRSIRSVTVGSGVSIGSISKTVSYWMKFLIIKLAQYVFGVVNDN